MLLTREVALQGVGGRVKERANRSEAGEVDEGSAERGDWRPEEA